jgi:hypothetical protein
MPTTWYAQASASNISNANLFGNHATAPTVYLSYNAGTGRFDNLLTGDTINLNNKAGNILNVNIIPQDSDTGLVLITNPTGGSLTHSGAFTVQINADLEAKTVTLITKTSGSNGRTLNILGYVKGGTSANAIGIDNASTGRLSIQGYLIGGTASSAYGVRSYLAGAIITTHDITGGGQSTAYGLLLLSCANLTVTGSVYGLANGAPGFYIATSMGSLSVLVTGDINGSNNGTGCYINSISGSITVMGNVIASTTNSKGIEVGGINPTSLLIQGSCSGGNGTDAFPVQMSHSPSSCTIMGSASYLKSLGYAASRGYFTLYGNLLGGYSGMDVNLTLNWTAANYFPCNGVKLAKLVQPQKMLKGTLNGDQVGTLLPFKVINSRKTIRSY